MLAIRLHLTATLGFEPRIAVLETAVLPIETMLPENLTERCVCARIPWETVRRFSIKYCACRDRTYAPGIRNLYLTTWLKRNLVLRNGSTERGKNRFTQKIGLKNDYERHYNVIAKMSESYSYDQLHPLILNAGDLESATRRPFSQNR